MEREHPSASPSLKVNQEIHLKRFSLDEIDSLFQLTDRNRDHLSQFLGWVDFVTKPEHTRQFIERQIVGWESKKGFSYGIHYQEKLVGAIALPSIHWADRAFEIGYWLDEKHQMKGIMTRACQAVIDHAFNNLSLHRAEIRCMKSNHRSRGIPERLNFTEEGVAREAHWQHDHYEDLVVYSLLSTEF